LVQEVFKVRKGKGKRTAGEEGGEQVRQHPEARVNLAVEVHVMRTHSWDARQSMEHNEVQHQRRPHHTIHNQRPSAPPRSVLGHRNSSPLFRHLRFRHLLFRHLRACHLKAVARLLL
jgi:hypothetical protein